MHVILSFDGLLSLFYFIFLVHGTWVSGKKIEAGVRVEMNEGDTMQLGGSSRVYRLHWVPLSHVYDMDNPFVSPLDVSRPVEEGEGGGMDQVRVFSFFSFGSIGLKCRVATICLFKFLTHIFFFFLYYCSRMRIIWFLKLPLLNYLMIPSTVEFLTQLTLLYCLTRIYLSFSRTLLHEKVCFLKITQFNLWITRPRGMCSEIFCFNLHGI